MNAETEMDTSDGMGADPRRDEDNQAALDAATAPDEFDPGQLPENTSELSDEEYEEVAHAAHGLVGKWIVDGNGVWQVTNWAPDDKDGWATIGDGHHWNRPEEVELAEHHPAEPRKVSDEAALDALIPVALGGSGSDVAAKVYELLRDTGRVYPT